VEGEAEIAKVRVLDLGLVEYAQTWDLQKNLHQHLVKRKRFEDYKSSLASPLDKDHYFILCQHSSVFTLGKSGSEDHLLKSLDELADQGIDYFKINRGGDITYHGPGQIVGYPLLDLDNFFTDVHKYVRFLEELIIRVLAKFDILGFREKDYTGVWVEFDAAPHYRKICAIGVHLSRWVTMHGFAFNVANDLSPFGYIIPCGINESNRGICSLTDLVGQRVNIEEVNDMIIEEFGQLFECEMIKDNEIPMI